MHYILVLVLLCPWLIHVIITLYLCRYVCFTGLDRTHHVYESGGVIYNAVLGLVDVVQGTNSFYKLQVLESDAAKK